MAIWSGSNDERAKGAHDEKADGAQATASTTPTVAGLAEIGTRWRAEAQAEEEKVLAVLREQAAEAVAAGEASLPVYAAVAAQHEGRLQADQREFKSDVYARSRWVGDLATVLATGAEILTALMINPPAIRRQLGEIRDMTIGYARSYRLRDLCDQLIKNADTGQQLPEKVREYDAALAILWPRLERERPDLAPRPVLASAGLDGPPSGPRRAKGTLSGDDA